MKTKLYSIKLLMIPVMVFMACKDNEKKVTEPRPFDQADAIIKSIEILDFPNETLNILDFGAVPDGTTLNTTAIARAIDSCNHSGGGKVVIPAGDFLTGPIILKSNVNLHLEAGANVLFSTNHNDFLPVVHTSYEGVELMNYSPLIRAYKQKNIAVTGKGTFNGQASNTNWWPWCGKDSYGWEEGAPKQHDSINLPRLRKMNEVQTPISERVFGEGHHIRPTFFEPFECENVLLQGVTFTNAPFWVIHPLKCNDVRIDGVTVSSHGPNNDGCDPEYSKNVHITNCTFDTGDDCIAIKAGRNEDGRRVNMTSENIVIENCDMKDGHGGVVLGSEISAGVRNVFVRNCKMDSPNLDRAIRIKTNTLRGGFVENLHVKNIQVGQVKEAALKINLHYGIYANQEGGFIPKIDHVHLQDMTVENSGKYGILIKGREEAIIKNVTLTNVHIKHAETPLSVEHSEPIVFKNTTINGKAY
ncbi:glycoside hydrolase family 28 protein [Aestuariivivens sediminis]|uniref:glycoside hydrolase family 28 protein n=1 Tax=Aestuariivivens sediminis TaxID=2913557 RepID=UPI001F5AAB57|nr:glycoside hydrolase family 28 protein [Aestuariivivens sediminis]